MRPEDITSVDASTPTVAAAGAGISPISIEPGVAVEKTIPKRIHFIWLGPSPLPMRYLWNIFSCHILNSEHYEVHLWVNPEYFITPDDHEYRRFNFLHRHGIKLRNYHHLFKPTADSKTTKEDELLLKCIEQTYLKRPVIAADILRIKILADKDEGGLYYDTDTLFKKSLPDVITCIEGTGLIIDETVVSLSSGKEIHSFCNSFIASTAGGREILHLTRALLANLRYLTQFGIKELEAISTEQIIKNTGPFLFDYLCQLTNMSGKEKHCQRNFSRLLYDDLCGTKSHFYDRTWVVEPGIQARSYDWALSTALFLQQRNKLNHARIPLVIDTGGHDETADELRTKRALACGCAFTKRVLN